MCSYRSSLHGTGFSKEPLLLIVTSAGATNGAGQFNSILSIPNNPALEGFAIGHQSAVLLGVDLVLSNVAFGIVTSCEVTG